MRRRRSWLALLVVLWATVAACNETIGDCYLVGQGAASGDPGTGFPTAGAGAGPSGDAPSGEAQSALTMAQCNSDTPSRLIMPPGPCEQRCQDDYDAAALGCGSVADDAQRKTCQDKAYADYKVCRDSCATTQKTCLDMYEDCISRGYAPCNKKVGGTTLCAICQDNCRKGNPYKFAQCTECGFE